MCLRESLIRKSYSGEGEGTESRRPTRMIETEVVVVEAGHEGTATSIEGSEEQQKGMTPLIGESLGGEEEEESTARRV